MSDHVAVLRRVREFLAQPLINDPEAVAALDHAIAACEERDRLVARLGELEKAARDVAGELTRDPEPGTPLARLDAALAAAAKEAE